MKTAWKTRMHVRCANEDHEGWVKGLGVSLLLAMKWKRPNDGDGGGGRRESLRRMLHSPIQLVANWLAVAIPPLKLPHLNASTTKG
jgi:hypothetical protein